MGQNRLSGNRVNERFFPHFAQGQAGDKPRCKQSFAETAGAGFIPTRESACRGNACRREFALIGYYLKKKFLAGPIVFLAADVNCFLA